MSQKARYLLATTRIALGWIFIWGFIDKLFGLGFATAPDSAWIRGGSPTAGFLSHAVTGPLAGFYGSMAGSTVVDVLFMFAILALGISLLLGIGMRIASVAGPIFLLMLWSAALPPANNPIIDEHIIYALAIPALAATNAGKTWGLGRWWEEKVGKTAPILV